MIRLIFKNGEIADCENVERIIFDPEELVKEVKITRNLKDGLYILELVEVGNNE